MLHTAPEDCLLCQMDYPTHNRVHLLLHHITRPLWSGERISLNQDLASFTHQEDIVGSHYSLVSSSRGIRLYKLGRVLEKLIYTCYGNDEHKFRFKMSQIIRKVPYNSLVCDTSSNLV